GHVELHDLVTWQLASLCQIFLWMQPFYWILRRELRVAQDQLADQFATEQTRQHAIYATTLLELSRARQRVLPGALTMAGGKSNLYRRIEMLMNEKFRLVRVSRKSIVLSFAILFVVSGGLLMSLQLTQAATVSAPATASQPPGNPVQTDEKTTVKNDTEEKKSAEHSGVVVDADTGKPIPGVTVTVTRMESGDWRELAVTQSVTDEAGKYTFTIPPEQLKERLLYIMFDIDHPEYAQRHCGSYGYGMIVKNLEHGEQPWFSQLKMVRGEKITGRLVDENQKPLAGVQIRCQCRPKSGYDRVRSTWIDDVTGNDGQFELVVTHDGMTKISLIPPDHCMKHIDVGEKRGDIGDITLINGFPIHGVVKDAKGNPMSGLWVNLTPEAERQEASYEMKRSAKTDKDGKYRSRPLKPGKYQIEVQTKATGALEKLKYANFHNTPPEAMFVTRSINVTEDSARQPLVVQAVPHVLITVQHFKPNGDVSAGHSPSLMGSFDGQRMWIRKGRRTGKGAYELMAPHGFENVELRFTTNEHSGLMVQFEGGELTPRDIYRFERLEGDIDNIRVVRHPAGILKLNIVDESGKQLKEGRIFANYELAGETDDQMMMGAQIGWNRENGLFRLSSLVPGTPFSVRFSASGFQTQTKKFTMKEGERRTVTITLKKGESEKPFAAK
ncbi:MAG: M56 family metallopeptidase, partial [Pirellulales bacterium]|nr:M56 family metallopeptidase [Pirellulales bacterium]